jgi:uncharacterized membrane protein YgdD (TMEM256/DUF423 family)
VKALSILAAITGAALVAAAAAGAHLVPESAGERWTSALLLGFVHVLAALIAAQRPSRIAAAAGGLFLGGVILFSGVQMARLLAGAGSGAATPFDAAAPLVPAGGLALIAGWLVWAAAFARR